MNDNNNSDSYKERLLSNNPPLTSKNAGNRYQQLHSFKCKLINIIFLRAITPINQEYEVGQPFHPF